MGARRFQVEIEWDAEDGVWVTYVPALGHLSTYGETREEALAQTQEAVLGYLEAAAKDDLPVPGGRHKFDIVEIEVAAP
jgi:predicted RNase H-like HicB family nuclease